MATENWTEERERLVELLRDFEAGKITRLDEVDDGAIKRETTEERLTTIKQRLAALDERLGSREID